MWKLREEFFKKIKSRGSRGKPGIRGEHDKHYKRDKRNENDERDKRGEYYKGEECNKESKKNNQRRVRDLNPRELALNTLSRRAP